MPRQEPFDLKADINTGLADLAEDRVRDFDAGRIAERGKALLASASLSAKHADSVETDDARQRRLAWEAERIAEARADLDAGRFIHSAEVDAWFDSIGTDHELPVPYCGR